MIVVEEEMLKITSKLEMLIGSNSKVYMDIDFCENDDPEKISLPNGKGSSKIKLFDRVVKRNG